MSDFICTHAGCDFTAEDTDNDYSSECRNCGRRDPMAQLVLTVMEREAEAMDELESEWQEVREGFARQSRRDSRIFTINLDGRLPVVWESEGRWKRRVGEYPSIAGAVIAARTADHAPYLDDPPF